MKITLPLPPPLNSLYATFHGRRLLSAKGRAYKAMVAIRMKAAGIRPHAGPMTVELQIYRARKSGDIDAYLKCLLDAMSGCAYDDDSQIERLHVWRRDDKNNPRVEICVYPTRVQTLEISNA